MEIRKPIKRIEVFFSRIEGEYPRLKFFVGDVEIPLLRGRLRLEGELTEAEMITVVAGEDAAFVPVRSDFPIVRGRVFIELMPATAESDVPEGLMADINLPGEDEATLVEEFEKLPPDSYDADEDDEFEGKKRASGRTIRILIAACLVCVGVIVWFFVSDRFISDDARVADSDSIKTDTLAAATAQDTAKTDTAALTPAAVSTPSPGYGRPSGYSPEYSYSSDDDAEAEAQEAQPKKRTLPEGTNLVEEQEH